MKKESECFISKIKFKQESDLERRQRIIDDEIKLNEEFGKLKSIALQVTHPEDVTGDWDSDLSQATHAILNYTKKY